MVTHQASCCLEEASCEDLHVDCVLQEIRAALNSAEPCFLINTTVCIRNVHISVVSNFFNIRDLSKKVLYDSVVLIFVSQKTAFCSYKTLMSLRDGMALGQLRAVGSLRSRWLHTAGMLFVCCARRSSLVLCVHTLWPVLAALSTWGLASEV